MLSKDKVMAALKKPSMTVTPSVLSDINSQEQGSALTVHEASGADSDAANPMKQVQMSIEQRIQNRI